MVVDHTHECEDVKYQSPQPFLSTFFIFPRSNVRADSAGIMIGFRSFLETCATAMPLLLGVLVFTCVLRVVTSRGGDRGGRLTSQSCHPARNASASVSRALSVADYSRSVGALILGIPLGYRREQTKAVNIHSRSTCKLLR